MDYYRQKTGPYNKNKGFDRSITTNGERYFSYVRLVANGIMGERKIAEAITFPLENFAASHEILIKYEMLYLRKNGFNRNPPYGQRQVPILAQDFKLEWCEPATATDLAAVATDQDDIEGTEKRKNAEFVIRSFELGDLEVFIKFNNELREIKLLKVQQPEVSDGKAAKFISPKPRELPSYIIDDPRRAGAKPNSPSDQNLR